MARPLLLLASFLALGCFVGEGVDRRQALFLVALAAALLGLALAAQRPRSSLTALAAAATAIGASGAGIERAAYARSPLLRWVETRGDADEPVRLSGIAAADAREAGDRWVLLLDVDLVAEWGRERPLAGRVRVQVAGSAPRADVIEGDRLTLWASLRQPRSFGNPGSFDAEAAARREGIHALGHTKSPLLVERLGREGGGTVPIPRARRWARTQLRAAMLPGAEEGVVRAMVLGDRSGVAPDTAEAFRVAGTYHVLAISGAQVALVAGLLLAGARLAGASPVPTALLVSATLAFYAEFVGGDPPVARAAVMAIVMLLGRCLDLDSDLANLLGLAAGLLLLQRPSAIGDPAFQLSFAATLGILLLTAPLVARLPRLPFGLQLAVAASLAAQLPLAPLLALHFHRLAPAALALNLVAVPLSGLVLIAGLAVLLLAAAVPPLAPLAGDAAWIAAHALLRSADVVRVAPGLDVRVPSPGLWAVALLLAGVVLLSRRPRTALALATLGVAGLVAGPEPPPGDGLLHLTILDVGQGDCLVIQSPSGRFRLVDAGGAYEGGFDFGEAVVGPYLWSQGVRRIDGLLLTHAHPDHVGGAPFVVKAFGAPDVWEGPAPTRDSVYRSLSTALAAAGVSRRSVAHGVRERWDGVELDVLGPRPRGPGPWRARNDDSVVVALRLGDVRFLLAGDAEATEEADLPATPSAVLKVAHHGSRTSSTPAFVAATSPLVCVVSVGHRNHFGHPHAEILKRYLGRGTRLYRTDEDGAVTISTDGAHIWVDTFRWGHGPRVR